MKWIEQKRNDNPAMLNQWASEQSLPLSVYIKEAGQWKLAEKIPTVGPLAARDLCIPINLSKDADEITEIKLSCGFMFW